jgi:hypothetical protein
MLNFLVNSNLISKQTANVNNNNIRKKKGDMPSFLSPPLLKVLG